MNVEQPTGPEHRPDHPALRLDAACDRFDAAWKEGRRPRIEDYLGEATESERPQWLEALLDVELDFRRDAGEALTPDEYHRRFPGHPQLIADAFDESQPRAGAERTVPKQSAADHNLLFGLLALQNNFIDRDALLAAFNAWVADKSRALGQDPARPRRPRRRPARPAGGAGPGAPQAARRRPARAAWPPSAPSARSATTSRESPTPRSRPACCCRTTGRSAPGCPDGDADAASSGTAACPLPDPPAARQGRPGRGLRRPATRSCTARWPSRRSRPARRRPGQPRPVRARGRDHRPAGASGDRPGLRPGHRRRRPAVLRHAVHPGGQPQGGDRSGSTRPTAPGRDPGERAAGACASCCGGSSTSATRSPTRTAGACCTAT